MFKKFEAHIHLKFPFLISKKVLIAVSGGLDSMVLLYLMQKLGAKVAVAHCNFQLRGLESFGDQDFVQNYAQSQQIKAFVVLFETKKFAETHKLSTQVAARELRYGWFSELLEQYDFDYLLTAHQADDNLETFLINLSRGSGLDGLVGIPAFNKKLIRPLLPFSRQEIETFAQKNNLTWREDSSNASDYYLRNKIRHHLVPVIKELNPNFLLAFEKTQKYLQESQAMAQDAAKQVYEQVTQSVNACVYFDLKKLLQQPHYPAYLYQWLHPFGFSAWEDIYNLAKSNSGKQVFSDSHRLLKNRDFLILTTLHSEDDQKEFLVYKNTEVANLPIKITFSNTETLFKNNNSVIFVDEDQLTFPLILRRWQTSDSFYPFGMNGKTKKVSKFFKDEKLSLIEKENVWILCSKNQIVWIVGLRQDERFRTSKNTRNWLKIQISPSAIE